MSKKALGLDKFGVQKVMRKGDYFADSLGQFALNSIAGLVGQLTYFYTDKVGMAEALTPAVRQAIYAFSIYIPLTLFVIMFILTAMFDLEAKLPELREQTRMRKEAKN